MGIITHLRYDFSTELSRGYFLTSMLVIIVFILDVDSRGSMGAMFPQILKKIDLY